MPSSASSILESYRLVEDVLAEIIAFIPYDSANRDKFAPKLGNVILQACRCLCSIYDNSKINTKLGDSSADALMAGVFTGSGRLLADRWTLFWGPQPLRIYPYDMWRECNPNDFCPERYADLRPAWWQAYFELDENCVANIHRGTLDHAVHAMSALLVAMLSDRDVCRQIADSDWVPLAARGEPLWSDCAPNDSNVPCTVVETRLFAYPLGMLGSRPGEGDSSAFLAGPRFTEWLARDGVTK